MTENLLITFAAVAQPLAEHGWRPFPGLQRSKIPAMQGWPGLNTAEWDTADLAAAVSEFQSDSYCCCIAIQPEIVAIDSDIIDHAHAALVNELAGKILGETPLVRVGLAPKKVHIYRTNGAVKSRKLHPIEVFSGTGQIVAFGWHAKAGRPYIWPQASPLTTDSDSDEIPTVTQTQIEHFTTEIFKVVPRRLTRQSRPGGMSQTVGDRLRMLTVMKGSWKRAAAIVLSEAGEGTYNDTLWAVITSAAGRGISEDDIWQLVEKHFNGDPNISDAKLASDIASMIERTRPVRRQHQSLMTFHINR